MPTTSDGREQRQSWQYGRCPRCELIVPLTADATTGDPELGVPPQYSGALRCGLCAQALVVPQAWPLDFERDCIACGAVILAPEDAAMVACAACDGLFLNPLASPEVRAAVDRRLAERSRMARMVATLDERVVEADASIKAERIFESGWQPQLRGDVTPQWEVPPQVRVPEDWIEADQPLPDVFRRVFQQAVRLNGQPFQQAAAILRYGLDGQPGRTYREIGLELGRSPYEAREIHNDLLARIQAEARRGIPDPQWPAGQRACAIVVHIATDVIGDPDDARTPGRMRAFVDQAFPNADPKDSAMLLTELADYSLELFRAGRQQALSRAVADVRPAP